MNPRKPRRSSRRQLEPGVDRAIANDTAALDAAAAVNAGASGDAAVQPGEVTEDLREMQEEVERRAYNRFCERGCVHGYALDDWIAAEAEVLAERSSDAARRLRR